jgi:hypothetical protein
VRLSATLVLLVFIAYAPAGRAAPAAATPVEPPAAPAVPTDTPHTAVYFLSGFGTPVGLFGVEAVHRFGRWFEISAGVGVGAEAALFAKQTGSGVLQWSVMPRLRAGSARYAFTFGTGVSGGNYAKGSGSGECYFVCTDPPPAQYTTWANVEAGFEMLMGREGRNAFRAFLGAAHGWADPSPVYGAVGSPTIPYVGVGFGKAF